MLAKLYGYESRVQKLIATINPGKGGTCIVREQAFPMGSHMRIFEVM